MELSIVVPVYNAESHILATYQKLLLLAKHVKLRQFEIILVNDHSTDNTLDLLQQINDERVKIFCSRKNYGQNGATFIGLVNARFPFTLTIDDDFPYQMEDVAHFIGDFISSQKSLYFGIPSRYPVNSINYYQEKMIIYILKLSFPRHRKVLFHSSLRVFNASVKDKLMSIQPYSPLAYLSVPQEQVGFVALKSKRNKTIGRYTWVKYFLYYKTEIIAIAIPILVICLIITILCYVNGQCSVWSLLLFSLMIFALMVLRLNLGSKKPITYEFDVISS